MFRLSVTPVELMVALIKVLIGWPEETSLSKKDWNRLLTWLHKGCIVSENLKMR
jgi:hypothetical protein